MEDADEPQRTWLCYDGYRFCKGKIFQARIMTFFGGGGLDTG